MSPEGRSVYLFSQKTLVLTRKTTTTKKYDTSTSLQVSRDS